MKEEILTAKTNIKGFYNNSISIKEIPQPYLYGREKKFPFEITIHERGSANRLYLSKTGLLNLNKLISKITEK